MPRVKMNCPKCGQLSESNMPETNMICLKCGQRFNLMEGTCEHGKRNGQCDDSRCPFKK